MIRLQRIAQDRILKTCSDATHQYEWLSKLPEGCAPTPMTLHDDSQYEMRFVEGSYPDWRRVHAFLLRRVWTAPGDTLAISRDEYWRYITEIARSVLGTSTGPVVAARLERISSDQWLSPVTRCHGDATIMNFVQRDDNSIVALDPGHSRWLPCRELDESKILQSLDGWDHIRAGAPMIPPMPRPSWVRRIHYVLLLTHYIRLLMHADLHPEEARIFAVNRIRELREALGV